MSAKRDRETGALDYRDDDDDNTATAEQDTNKKKHSSSSSSSSIRVTRIPVQAYKVSYNVEGMTIRPLERLINEALLKKTGGKELIWFDVDWDRPDSGPGRRITWKTANLQDRNWLMTRDALRYIEADRPVARTRADGDALDAYSEHKERDSVLPRTAPLLIFMQPYRASTNSENTSGYHSSGTGGTFSDGWFPYAKLVYIPPIKLSHDISNISIKMSNDDVMQHWWSNRMAISDPMRSEYATSFLSISEYVQALRKGPTPLVPEEEEEEEEEHSTDDTRQFLHERRAFQYEVRLQKIRNLADMDPEFKDDPYVYAHAANSVARCGIELAARSVELDMDIDGDFVDSDRHHAVIEHLVEWIMRFSDINDRRRIKVLDRDGPYPMVLNRLINQYASGETEQYTRAENVEDYDDILARERQEEADLLHVERNRKEKEKEEKKD
jgi:hypothetical protein